MYIEKSLAFLGLLTTTPVFSVLSCILNSARAYNRDLLRIQLPVLSGEDQVQLALNVDRMNEFRRGT